MGMGELTRMEFIEQVTALERRLNERFDMLERLVALGFDDTTDQLRMRFGELDVVHTRPPFVTRGPSPDERRATGRT
jgi:hypothetical protein